MVEVAPARAGFRGPLPAFEARGKSADRCSGLKQKLSGSLVQEGCLVISHTPPPDGFIFFLC